MSFNQYQSSAQLAGSGAAMHALMAELYPICRSITGDGLRATLRRIQQLAPLQIHDVPSGTKVFDWTVPLEWNIRDAYVKNPRGEKVIDFKQHNLHVLNYSVPVAATIPWSQLKEHLFTLPEQPELIPYRTSYYTDNWGFCLPHRRFQELGDGDYEVCIDSTLQPGHLTYGEYFLPGSSSDEILLSCHACHPSLCNDNLSGVALVAFLAGFLKQFSLRYSYRFLFIPGTIGSITWLSLNEKQARRIKHGLVVACTGDPGKSTYKKSRQGDAEIDRAVLHVLRHSGQAFEVLEFSPYGYDERQYCSPGFNLAVGSLTRTPHGRFPQYHTSADNLELVRPEFLEDSLRKYLAVLFVLENNRIYRNKNPKCEPQLGKRGLYRALGGLADAGRLEMAMLWVLNLSDGTHSLLDIASKADLPFELVQQAAHTLEEHDLLES